MPALRVQIPQVNGEEGRAFKLIREFAVSLDGPKSLLEILLLDSFLTLKNLLQTWGICTRRAGKLYKARSRLYRSQILQVNTRWKTLAEIYTMHSFAPLWNRIPKNQEKPGKKRAWPRQHLEEMTRRSP